MYNGMIYLDGNKQILRRMDYRWIKFSRYQAQAKVFTGTLLFDNIVTTGNGYTYYTFKDESGITFPVFKRDAAKMLRLLNNGTVSGTFAFRKMGYYVGIYMLGDSSGIELFDKAIL